MTIRPNWNKLGRNKFVKTINPKVKKVVEGVVEGGKRQRPVGRGNRDPEQQIFFLKYNFLINKKNFKQHFH